MRQGSAEKLPFGMAVSGFHFHVDQGSDRGGFRQLIRTLIIGVIHMGSDTMHVKLDFTTFYQVLNLINVPMSRHWAIYRLKRR